MNKLPLVWKQTTFPPTSWLCNDLGKQKQTCKAWFGARATLRVRFSFSLKSHYNIDDFPFTIDKPVTTTYSHILIPQPELIWDRFLLLLWNISILPDEWDGLLLLSPDLSMQHRSSYPSQWFSHWIQLDPEMKLSQHLRPTSAADDKDQLVDTVFSYWECTGLITTQSLTSKKLCSLEGTQSPVGINRPWE